jgi:hypothetical protein
MNQRLKPRLPVRIPVEVQFPGCKPMTVLTRDISQGGMFLQTGEAPFPSRSIVGVKVRSGSGQPRDSIQLVALVIRQNRDGLAVSYPLCSESASRRIRGLMETAHDAPHPGGRGHVRSPQDRTPASRTGIPVKH